MLMSTIFNNPTTSGKMIRLGRILHPTTGRSAVVAFDHGLHLGVIPGVSSPGHTLEQLAEAGADAFLVSPGVARAYTSVFVGRGAPGMILRLDWTNLWRGGDLLGSEEGRDTLIATVEDAARMGADAVLVYLFVGYEDPAVEAQQVGQVAHLAQACEQMGMGCIIEPMARGIRVGVDIYQAKHIALGARIACELGADILKTDYSGDSESFAQVVESAFRPILIAGGPKTPTLQAALEMVSGALAAGAQGMFIGRNVFQATDPQRMMSVLRAMIHQNLSVSDALHQLE